MAETKYLIWSIEHCGWWKQSMYGYTTATHRAGIFSKSEADDIKNPDDIAVPAPTRNQVDNDLTCDLDYPQAERIGRVDAALARQLSRSMQINAALRPILASIAKHARHKTDETIGDLRSRLHDIENMARKAD